jgi:hypothetical protein
LRPVIGITLALVGLLDLVAAEAQPAAKIPRIGYLATSLAGIPPASREAFLQGCASGS